MTKKDYSQYKQLKEVYFANDADKLVKQGWELIDVLQRASIHDEGGAVVVFVLGSEEVKPSTPQPVELDYSAGEDL